MVWFELDPDEKIVLTVERVALKSNPLVRGDLVLTDRSVIYAREVGVITKKTEVTRYPVSWVSVRDDGLVAVDVLQPAMKGADFMLTVHFADFGETFLLPGDQRVELVAWVECLNELVTGRRVAFDPSSMKTVEVGKTVQGVLDKAKPMVDKAKPMAAKAAQAARPYLPMAAELLKKNPRLAKFGRLADMGVLAADALGKAAGAGTTGKAGAAQANTAAHAAPGAETHRSAPHAVTGSDSRTQHHSPTNTNAHAEPETSSQPAKEPNGSGCDPASSSRAAARPHVNGLSLDEQIEALKKLKELVDAGILTQEEFDAKKRQIMGL